MSRDSSLRQRGSGRYSMQEHGGSEMGGGSLGKMYLKPGTAELWGLRYGEGMNVVRFLPIWDRETQQFTPFRESTEPLAYGDWIRRYPAVRNFGDPGVSFLLNNPADPHPIDQQMLPPVVLYNACKDAKAKGVERPGWAGLLDGGQNRGAKLSKPNEVYLANGILMQHGTNLCNPPKGLGDSKPLIVEMSGDAGRALLEEMDKMIEGTQAVAPDWDNIYINGDILRLDWGAFVTFYKTADGDPRSRTQQAAVGWNMPAPGQQGGGRGREREVIGYSCYIERQFMGCQPVLANVPGFLQTLQMRSRSWDDILHFPSVDDMASMCCERFPADLIAYAFQNHPEWISESVKATLAARTSMVMSGGDQQGYGGFGGQAPQQQFQQPGGAFGAVMNPAPQQQGIPSFGGLPPAGPPVGVAPGVAAMTGAAGMAPAGPGGFGAQTPGFPPQTVPPLGAPNPGFPQQQAPPQYVQQAPPQYVQPVPPQYQQPVQQVPVNPSFGAPNQQPQFPQQVAPAPQVPTGFGGGMQTPPPNFQQGVPQGFPQQQAPPQQAYPQQQVPQGFPQQQMPQQQMPQQAPVAPQPVHAPAAVGPQWGDSQFQQPQVPGGQPVAGFAAPPVQQLPQQASQGVMGGGRAAAALAAAQAAAGTPPQG